MLSLVAAAVLAGTEPSAANLAARFVEVQAALPGAQPTYDGWTRQQLDAEWRRLNDLRPGIGLPITLLAAGGAVALLDLVVFVFGGLISLLSRGGFDTPVVVAIAMFAVVAVGAIIIGAIQLSRARAERRELDSEIDLIKAAIEALTPAAPIAPPPEEAPVPPPTSPYPLQVQRSAPFVMVTLARF